MKSTSKRKNLIYDVGLHHGQDTDFYLKKGFEVVAFEANPANIDVCKKRFASAIAEGKLTIVEGGIAELEDFSDKGQKIEFYRNHQTTFWGSTDKEFAYRNEVMGTTNEKIEINAVNFAECLEKYGIPFYLKADIVGSEKICLRALLKFENKPDYLSIRSEKVIWSNLQEEFNLLERLGYDRFKAIQQDVTDFQVAIDGENGKKIKYTFDEGASGVFAEETAGKWQNKAQILKQYNKIFTLYWLFGDYSYLLQREKGKKFIAQLERIARRPLPGWYDTHAKHSSV